MPIIEKSGYLRRPFYMINGHFETVVPSMFFKDSVSLFERSRMELEDGDFLDVDWLATGNKRCMIVTHGLEGSSDRYYVKRTARYFNARGWDIAAWNCRSCSGEMNRLPRFYHHGDTEDLHRVVQDVLDKGYDEVLLFGYSMGGSIILKYLGEEERSSQIIGATVYSVPCNLRDSAVQLTKKGNQIYEKKFLNKLLEKIKVKAAQHEAISIENLESIKTFDDFHDRYTAPLHGFSSREEFFEKATCDQFFGGISVPVLLVNALNDPMLGELCYPVEAAKNSQYLYLEMPKVGGHCGFTYHGKPHGYMEESADIFIKSVITPLVRTAAKPS